MNLDELLFALVERQVSQSGELALKTNNLSPLLAVLVPQLKFTKNKNEEREHHSRRKNHQHQKVQGQCGKHLVKESEINGLVRVVHSQPQKSENTNEDNDASDKPHSTCLL